MGINHSDFEKNLDLKRPRTRQSQSFFRKKKNNLICIVYENIDYGTQMFYLTVNHVGNCKFLPNYFHLLIIFHLLITERITMKHINCISKYSSDQVISICLCCHSPHENALSQLSTWLAFMRKVLASPKTCISHYRVKWGLIN